jgi:hypothetical protein
MIISTDTKTMIKKNTPIGLERIFLNLINLKKERKRKKQLI